MLGKLIGKKKKEAREGLGTGFSGLYSLHAQAVYRYAFYKTGDTAASEDLTEEAFVTAFDELHPYGAEIDGSIVRVFRLADLLADRWPRRNDPGRPDQSGRGEESLPDHAELVRALRSLPKNVGQVVALRMICGLDCSTVGEITGRTDSEVKDLIIKGVRLLHEVLRQSSHPLGLRLNVGNEAARPAGQLHISPSAG